MSREWRNMVLNWGKGQADSGQATDGMARSREFWRI